MRHTFMIYALLLAICAVPTRGDENTVPTIAEAYHVLRTGEVDQAREAFQTIADNEPDNKIAWEGLTWAALRAGAIEDAIRAARKRESLDPSDHKWQLKRLNIMLDSPEWRDEAVRELRSMVSHRPDDPEPRFALARALSLFVGEQFEAVKHYRAGLAARDEPEERLGLARALAWSGQGQAAAVEYEKLLADDPDFVDALVGRARVARWHGDLVRARQLNMRAREQAPDDPRPYFELARVALNEERPHAARSHARRGGDLSTNAGKADELLDEIAAARAIRLHLFGTQHEEPLSGLTRRSSGAMIDLPLIGDLKTRLEGSYSRFFDGVENLDRVTAGLYVRYPMPWRIALSASYRNHRFLMEQENVRPFSIQTTPDNNQSIHSWNIEIDAHAPNAPISLRLGVRQRLLVDAPVDESRVAPFYESGTGGMTVSSILEHIQIFEGHASISGAPVRGTFFYAVGSFGQVEYGNDRASAVAGAGYNLGSLMRLRSHRIIAGYNWYYLNYALQDERFFSPEGFFVHGIQMSWKWNFVKMGVVGLSAGYSLNNSGDDGASYTGYFALPIGTHFQIEARSRYFDNTVFRTITTSLLIGARF